MCKDCAQVPVPVGRCFHCEETFVAEDSGVIDCIGNAMHYNCFLRGIIGSVAHLQKVCCCFVRGASEGDPPGMTRRQAADAAVKLWETLREVHDQNENRARAGPQN